MNMSHKFTVTAERLSSLIAKAIMRVFKYELVPVNHMEDSSKYLPKKFNEWDEYWEYKTGRKFPKESHICPCCGEEKDDFVGGHIVDIFNKEFIYPICRGCNSRAGQSETFRVRYFVAERKDMVKFYRSESRIKHPEQ